MKTLITTISIAILLILTGCTKQVIKNKALVLSVEKFDNEALDAGKANYVDLEEQKIFAEFIKKNTKIDVRDVETQSDDEATGLLVIESLPKSIFPELKGVSGKDWNDKIKGTKEAHTYNLKMKKIKGSWEIIEQHEIK